MPDGRSSSGKREHEHRWGWASIATGALALLFAGLIGGWAVFVRETQPGAPGAFYDPPSPLPDGPPGTLIRSEVIDGFHPGATAYRVLYTSTGRDGSPTAVSGSF